MSLEEFTNKSYDYIICGGGTAGLVVAARLTEDPNVSVAVLEAGGNSLDDILVDTPGLFSQTWDKPQYDWEYKTVSQEGTGGKVHGWVRGKVLGGSSAINLNMFSMASRQDLDNWVELGNEGWGFDEMLPYYRKFETYHPCEGSFAERINDKYLDFKLRGTSGPIQTSMTEGDITWAQDIWPKTMLNAGYEPSKDPRSGSAIGGFNQLNTIDPKHKRRSYAARAYYEPNADRPNLSLVTYALVSKIELDNIGSDVKATSVQFIVHGVTHRIEARKEVIICGGSINSPQLLELSGIGSPAVLQKAGVVVVVENRSVGENLNDHTVTPVVLAIKDEYPSLEAAARNPDLMQQALEAYIQHRAGPLASATTTTSFTSLAKVQPEFSGIEKHVQALVAGYAKDHPDGDPAGRDLLLARQTLDPKESIGQIVFVDSGCDTSKSHTVSKVFPSSEAGMWCTLAVCSTHNLSRGYVHITSSDPATHPIIDPAYFKHPLDIDLIGRTVLHALTLTEVEPLKSVLRHDLQGGLITTMSSGGKLPKTLKEAKEFTRRNTLTQYHPIGTCAMLPKEKGGVVDNELRVYGTSNLRVVDASIFPTPVQGNIVSLVYAVAEKAADIIKANQLRSQT